MNPFHLRVFLWECEFCEIFTGFRGDKMSQERERERERERENEQKGRENVKKLIFTYKTFFSIQETL